MVEKAGPGSASGMTGGRKPPRWTVAPEEEIEAARQRLFDKLQKLREREMPRWLAEGWSHDESYDQMVPPGWIKGLDHRPREPEPEGPDFREQIRAGG